ncbi:hypothetical protein TL08_15305 [Actinoalloteichus hymeniacidonis]|uniref:Bacterial PH domain n=1 Tax=Actinoalloteichus hymeniacidonis TaxID=340345 RepID=A0AAC9MZ07_9PSEU|nr:hypothetical protein TL08_15305 [Actinoalloteichus hymeniacidonis]
MLTLRPTTERRVFTVALAVIISSIFIMPGAVTAGWIGILVGLAVVAAFVGLVALSRFRPLVVLTRTHLGHRGMFGGIRWIPRSLVKGIVHGPVLLGRTAPHTVFIADEGGRCLLRLMDGTFERADLDRLVAQLPAPVYPLPLRALTPNKLDLLYPGLTSWWERHPIGLAFIILAAVLIVTLCTAVIIAL